MVVFLLLVACSENGLTVDSDRASAGRHPQIQVVPDELSFPMLPAGEEEVQTLTITNVGDAELRLESMTLAGSGAFTVEDPGRVLSLEPEASYELAVRFSPTTAEDRADLTLGSNDEGDPAVRVPLSGLGAFPEALIEPDPFDFGRVPRDCRVSRDFSVLNVGLAPLTVESLVSVGEGFELESSSPLPAVVEPGAALPFVGRYTGGDNQRAEVWLSSDEPTHLRQGSWSATAVASSAVEETFRQGNKSYDSADIFVFVDQSGSMEDDQANLGSNAEVMWAALTAEVGDWQLVVTNNDDGCPIGGVFSPTSGSAAEFATAVRSGGGRYTEAGLTVATAALEQARSGCNAGFLRDHARTLVVLVSDEPEQSARPWDEMLEGIWALAPSTILYSVAGPVPSGCRTAMAGYGYAEASVASGGDLLELCDADWGAHFDVLATGVATNMTDTFSLGSVPDPATIEVWVNDVPSTGWSYDATGNTVVFVGNSVPPPDAVVRVAYHLDADCEW